MTAPAHGLTLWKVYYKRGKKRDAKNASELAGDNASLEKEAEADE